MTASAEGGAEEWLQAVEVAHSERCADGHQAVAGVRVSTEC